MMPPPVLPRRLPAFTLIELLASMSVLTLLLLVVVQMINAASAVTAGSTKRLDADSQARLVFDRMAVDFSQIVKRSDVDYFFQKNGTGASGGGMDDQMAFYSETSGYYPKAVTNLGVVPKSNAALIGYRIYKQASDTSHPLGYKRRLERLNKALIWCGVKDGTTDWTTGAVLPPYMTFLPQTLPSVWPATFNNSSAPDMTQSSDPDYQVIGEQVFRMETCYIVRNALGTSLSDKPYIPASGAVTTPPLPYNGLRDLVAAVVTIAVLDDTSGLIVKPADLDTVASKFVDFTGTQPLLATAATPPSPTPPPTPAKLWQSYMDTNDLSNASGGPGLPRTAASQIRIYERSFYVGNAQ